MRLLGLARQVALDAAAGRGVVRIDAHQGRERRRAIEAEEHRLGGRIAQHAPVVQARRDQRRGGRLQRQEGVVGRHRLAVLARRLGQGLDRVHQGVLVGEQREAQAVGVQAAHRLRHLRADQRPDPGRQQGLVEGFVGLRQARGRGEAQVVVGGVAAEGADVVQRAPLEPEQVLARDQVGIGLVGPQVADHRLIEAGRHQLDHAHAAGELGVLAPGHLARDEDAQVPGGLMQGVDDGLAVGDDLALVVVEVGDPAERLLGRSDLVAPRAEHDDRRAHVAQVDACAVRGAQGPRGQLVADEQVVGDPAHLVGLEQHRRAPPGLELEEALLLGVDLGIDVVRLGPEGVGGVQGLEIGDQVGAVEQARAQIARQGRHPAAAEQAARVAHPALALLPRPVRQRRAGQQDRAGQLRMQGGHDHGLPAGLAVGHHHRLALGFGMAGGDQGDEMGLGLPHVLHGLARDGFGQEADEIGGVAGGEGLADLALVLHAADARAMARPGVDHHERRLGGVDDSVLGRDHADQPIVDRALQGAAVADQLGLEYQHIGRDLGLVLEIAVAATTQDVEHQGRALPRVHPVFSGRPPDGVRTHDQLLSAPAATPGGL